ncbi:unnamed protein product [Euphydryas editha]|uniref:Uncharacterized protein n=1 Tax=Euphydryas editha TaxID=104508 RepID=A0AAU9TVZ0_EUPED|nr:unnamed protein product [Euphydryas editha]
MRVHLFQVPYKKRRLVESAVPTIFDKLTTMLPPVSDKPMDGMFDGSNSLEYQCESFEEPLMDTPNAECVDASCTMPCAQQETVQYEVSPVIPVPSTVLTSLNQEVVDSVSIVHGKSFVLSKIMINNLTSNVVTTEMNPITIPTSWSVTEYAEERGSDKPTYGVFDFSNSLEKQCESFEEPLMDTPDAECADASCAMPYAHQETVQHDVLSEKPVPSAASTSPNQEVDTASIVRGKNFVLSKITINDLTSNVVSSEKNPITIPTSWGVTEYTEERGQRVVFSNILRTNSNGTAITIIDKCRGRAGQNTSLLCLWAPYRFGEMSTASNSDRHDSTVKYFRGIQKIECMPRPQSG